MAQKTKKRNLKDHANHHAADLAYLRQKGYTDQEILAIWDRDAQRGQGSQAHANTPANSAKTTMTLMLRAFQAANCHIPDGHRRDHFKAMLKAQGIDDIDTLIGDFIERMNAIR